MRGTRPSHFWRCILSTIQTHDLRRTRRIDMFSDQRRMLDLSQRHVVAGVICTRLLRAHYCARKMLIEICEQSTWISFC